MHILELGVLLYLLGEMFRALVVHGIFGEYLESHPNSVEERLDESLYEHYRDKNVNRRSRVRYLSVLDFFNRDGACLSAKASQARGLLDFAILSPLRTDSAMPRWSPLTRATTHTKRIFDVMDGQPRCMSPASMRELEDQCHRFASQWRRCGRSEHVKHHAPCEHLSEQARLCGNHRWSHNFVDEGYNKVQKKVARSVHPAFLDTLVLSNWVLGGIRKTVALDW